jgi:hypothetical protein
MADSVSVSDLEQPAKDRRLVVYLTDDQARWIENRQQEARRRGRRLTASGLVRAAIDHLRATESHG